MPMYFVYKEEWFGYVEHRGMIVKSTSPNRAKGIAMAQGMGEGEPKSNIKVEEIEEMAEGILCHTDYILNRTDCN